jgi:hypothetical protein
MFAVEDEPALLIAIPSRHLQAARESGSETTVLPAGGPGDLDSCEHGVRVLVMPIHGADDADEVSAATWVATFLRRVPYTPGEPWPEGLPSTWTDEHPDPDPVPEPPPAPLADEADAREDDDWEDDDWEDDEDQVGPQSFLEVAGLRPLPRHEWLFANELVGKQARGGRTFQPRVPIVVHPID